MGSSSRWAEPRAASPVSLPAPSGRPWSKWTGLKLYKQVTGGEGGTQAHSPDPTADGNQGGGDPWSKGWGKPQPLPTQSLFYPTQGNSSLVISSEVHYLKKKRLWNTIFTRSTFFFSSKGTKGSQPTRSSNWQPWAKTGLGFASGRELQPHSRPSSFPRKGNLKERHGLVLDTLLKHMGRNKRRWQMRGLHSQCDRQ